MATIIVRKMCICELIFDVIQLTFLFLIDIIIIYLNIYTVRLIEEI